MSDAAPKPVNLPEDQDAYGVLTPLPLPSLDYLLAAEDAPTRGLAVMVDVGGRKRIGIVWGKPAGIEARKLKKANALCGRPSLPLDLCDFIDWLAAYTLAPPGLVLAMALRNPEALNPPKPRLAYAIGSAEQKPTKARARVLAVAADGLARTAVDLAAEAGVGGSVVKGLIQSGGLKTVCLPEFPPQPVPDPDFAETVLNPEQAIAAASILADVKAQAFKVSLLDGITGSGKTETYFEAVAEALRGGRQALILLPEIALTVQFLDRFAARFGARPAEWHSELSARERRRIWRAVGTGEVKAVVGARSALFLPFEKLGLIVVDEEHEQAYKQEEGVIYHARDMAVIRGKIASCPVILASATPSLESFVNAESGRYAHLKLTQRHGVAELPKVELIDLRKGHGDPGTYLSPPLRDALKNTLAAGEQAMLFLNRRGFAPLTLCESCGHKFTCRHCSAWLVEHRKRGTLVCHHCGFEMKIPDACPTCGEKHLIACGPGVERIAEEFQILFPEVRAKIASSDTLDGPNAMQTAIRAMQKREIDVLIGTQVIAKGHHFPHLTLVGVIDGDLGGSDGDPRARERTFQLLHQVSGRAGRAEHPGTVLIQTRNPADAVMQALVKQDRDAFYRQEMMYREKAGAPPFGRLAAIILSGLKSDEVRETGRVLARTAPNVRGVKVWGPAPAFYALLRGLARERLLVQADKSVNIQAYLHAWLNKVKLSRSVRLTVDVDPVSFF
jgi:primosomal protein N' (replication factor Y) (superfamily II helicase)